MEIPIAIGVTFVVICLFVYLLMKQKSGYSSLIDTKVPLETDAERRLREFIESGKSEEIPQAAPQAISAQQENSAPQQLVTPAAAPTPAPATSGPADPLTKVKELLKSGNKVDALRLYREVTGQGMRESMEAIDAMEKDSA